MGILALVLCGVIIANSIGLTQLGLGWDNSIEIKNPIINLVSLMYMRSMVIDTVAQQMDLKEFYNNSLINQTNVN